MSRPRYRYEPEDAGWIGISNPWGFLAYIDCRQGGAQRAFTELCQNFERAGWQLEGRKFDWQFVHKGTTRWEDPHRRAWPGRENTEGLWRSDAGTGAGQRLSTDALRFQDVHRVHGVHGAQNTARKRVAEFVRIIRGDAAAGALRVIAITLMTLSTLVLLTLGVLHLVYTFAGPKLTPRDPALQVRMSEVHPVITRQTTMWRAWIGFNASHSMGAILFGLVYGFLADAYPSCCSTRRSCSSSGSPCSADSSCSRSSTGSAARSLASSYRCPVISEHPGVAPVVGVTA